MARSISQLFVLVSLALTLFVTIFVNGTTTTSMYDLRVDLLMGRFDTTSSQDYIQYDWSGVAFAYSFSGVVSAPAIALNDNGNIYQVFLYSGSGNTSRIVDYTLLVTAPRENDSPTTYTLFDAYQDILNRLTTYTLVIAKRTEASFGIVKLYGFVRRSGSSIVVHPGIASQVVSGAKKSIFGLAVATNKPRSIEFLGDSLSCGYGNEGVSPCKFSASTENALRSFPILTANNFGANYSLTCWSGKGMVRNYADKNPTSVSPFPVYYPRTLANNEAKAWNWEQFSPDAVVITLGTNDFSTEPRPSFDEFSSGYNRLLDTILNNYYPKKPQIFCVSFGSIAAFGGYTETIVQQRNDKNIHYVKLPDWRQDQFGCSNHPTVEGDMEAAQRLTAAISSVYNN